MILRFLKYWLSFEWIHDYAKRQRPKGHTATSVKRPPVVLHTASEAAELCAAQLHNLRKNMPLSDVALARWRRDVEAKKCELAGHLERVAAGKTLHTTREARRRPRGG
jgi:hypothetical protein